MNIIQRMGLDSLTPEQIEAAVERFEAVMPREEVMARPARKCLVCISEARTDINRDLLQGIGLSAVNRKYEISKYPVVVFNHFHKHLLPLMSQEVAVRVMGLATRLEVNKRFPINGSSRNQIAWCLGQLMVARKLIVDEIDQPGISPFKRSALAFFVDVVKEIRDTAMLLHGGGRKKKLPDDLEEEIGEETKKAIEEARERRRQGKNKPTEVKSNEQQRQGSIEQDHREGEGEAQLPAAVGATGAIDNPAGTA